MLSEIREKKYFYSYFLLSIILLAGLFFSSVKIARLSQGGFSILAERDAWLSVYCLYAVIVFIFLDIVGIFVFGIVCNIFFLIYYGVAVASKTGISGWYFLFFLVSFNFLLYFLYKVYSRRDNIISRMNIVMEDWSHRQATAESDFGSARDSRIKLEERRSRYVRLTNIVSKFATTLDKNELQRICINETKEIIGRGEVRISELSDKEFSRDAVNKWVQEKNLPLLIENTRTDFRFSGAIFSEEWKSVIAVPVKTENSFSGLLRCSSTVENDFKEEDIRILSIVSDFLSIALTNCRLYEKTEDLAITDGLTGLYTKRYFMEKLSEEALRAEKFGTHLSLAMMDIDLFKKYNDSYGHQVGDEILKAISRNIREGLRDSDIVGRYGGEEFIILMPMAEPQDAFLKIDGIRKKVEAGGVVTISGGVTSYEQSSGIREKMIEKADRALYEAKRQGRNKVVIAT